MKIFFHFITLLMVLVLTKTDTTLKKAATSLGIPNLEAAQVYAFLDRFIYTGRSSTDGLIINAFNRLSLCNRDTFCITKTKADKLAINLPQI